MLSPIQPVPDLIIRGSVDENSIILVNMQGSIAILGWRFIEDNAGETRKKHKDESMLQDDIQTIGASDSDTICKSDFSPKSSQVLMACLNKGRQFVGLGFGGSGFRGLQGMLC